MPARFSKKELYGMIIEDLHERVVWHSDIDCTILLLDLEKPKRKLRLYVFNCTCPPGGRSLDEYKIQMRITGQKAGERGHLSIEDNRDPIIMGYACPLIDESDGVYVIWDANYHMDFAYSANIQCYLDPMLQALLKDDVVCAKKGNGEQVLYAGRKNLSKAIEKRSQLDLQNLLG